MKSIIPLVFVLMFLPLCCEKENLDPCENLDPDICFITTHKWVYSSYKVDGYDVIRNCDQDNFYSFKSDSTFQYEPGKELCPGETRDVINGNWYLNGSNLVIGHINSDGFQIYYNMSYTKECLSRSYSYTTANSYIGPIWFVHIYTPQDR